MPFSIPRYGSKEERKLLANFRIAVRDLNAIHSPFFNKLPSEIRNAIYAAALTSDDSNETFTPCGPLLRDRMAFLGSCYQIRKEAMRIFLTMNLFHLEIDTVQPERSPCFKWLGTLEIGHLRQMQHVRICLHDKVTEDSISAIDSHNLDSRRKTLGRIAKRGWVKATYLPKKLGSLGIDISKLDMCSACAPQDLHDRGSVRGEQSYSRMFAYEVRMACFRSGTRWCLKKEAREAEAEASRNSQGRFMACLRFLHRRLSLG